MLQKTALGSKSSLEAEQTCRAAVSADRPKYQRDGYLLARGLLLPDALKALIAEVTDLFDRPLQETIPFDSPAIWCWRHRPDGRRSIFRLSESRTIHALATGALHESCRTLADTEFLQLFECVIFQKPAGIGEQFAWHNDQSYYPTDPGNSISIWIALDVCDDETGALRFAKGSHRHRSVVPVDVKTGKPMAGSLEQELADPEKAGYETEMLPMNPGDGVFFDANAWHASPPNRSEPTAQGGICFRFWTEPTRYAPGPGKQAMFTRQLKAEPGALIDGPCFPIFDAAR